jgi:hypothetical protein
MADAVEPPPKKIKADPDRIKSESNDVTEASSALVKSDPVTTTTSVTNDTAAESASTPGSSSAAATGPLTNDDGQPYFELSSKKRFTVRNWKGNTLIDIREFYEKGDKKLPGKKGISLTVDQYKILKDLVLSGSIDAAVKSQGGDV